MDQFTKFRRHDVGERQIDTLVGLCKGIAADGIVNQQEAEFLQSWLVANQFVINDNPIVGCLLDRIAAMLEDGVLDGDESDELLITLRQFIGEESEIGELLKTTSLPVNQPQPPVIFREKIFLFTGTCATGNRKECRTIVESLGGINASNVTRQLDYLVIGFYVTESWKHETFGNKILQAMKYRAKYGAPAIVSESHWRDFTSI